MIKNAKFIFIHVPKTGGQSISAALGGDAGGFPKHAPMSDVYHGKRFAFGFVRNPWARMVSLYRFQCQKLWKPTDDYNQAETRALGFKAWLMRDEFFMVQDTKRDMPPMQRRPQLWWLEGVDFIGRFENIKEDFAHVVAHVGLKKVPPLGHINTTIGGDYRAEYDDESLAFVAEHFAPEIKRFGYKCE